MARWKAHGLSVLTATALTAACAPPADEQVLDEFFAQSHVYDRTMLARVATVAFNPRTDGVVEAFEVVERVSTAAPASERTQQTTLRADVRSAAGRTQERTLVVTLEGHEDAWIVTAVR